ncbi:MAG: hypothetical protein EXQ99_07390 [Alphaproteobacteria bacterium]|nr:hypothetical protein [Alphaproteobacteria bacterium]
MNEAPYITDIRNYGVDDYWATPKQFLYRDGDCEDYAIAKYMSFRSLGYTPDDLRLVVLQDNNLHITHAVLVTYLDGSTLVLDNQIKQVVEHSRIRHYSLYYSINETGWCSIRERISRALRLYPTPPSGLQSSRHAAPDIPEAVRIDSAPAFED